MVRQQSRGDRVIRGSDQDPFSELINPKESFPMPIIHVDPITQHSREVAAYQADFARADAAAVVAEDVAATFAAHATAMRAEANEIQTQLTTAQQNLAAAMAVPPVSL
jgi:hypothetical protein